MNSTSKAPTVLVVADDLKLVEFLRSALGGGCQLFVGPSVEVGLDRAREENLCLVVLDLSLPGLDSQAVIARIKAERGTISIYGFDASASALMHTPPLMAIVTGGQVVQMPVGWHGLLEDGQPRAYHDSSLSRSTPASSVPMMPIVPVSLPASSAGLPRPPAPPAEGHEPAPPTITPFPAAEAPPAIAEDPEAPLERSIATTFLRDGAVQMEHANHFEAASTDGSLIQGDILRVSPHFVVCEVLNPQQVLMPGWQTDEAVVVLARQEAYRGPARLNKALNTGRSLICEWTLQGAWKTPPASRTATLSQDEVLGPFFERMRILQRISQVFKAVIAEVASLLDEAKQGLDRIEISLQSQPEAARVEAMKLLLPQLHDGLMPALNQVFARFESASRDIPKDLDAEYHSLVRQHLHPYMMCSPFIHHIYSKPLGYAGDYGALQKLLGDPFEGHTLFAKLLNAWLVLNPAGEAYRTRVNTILEVLHSQAALCHDKGAEFRVLSIGCGAANEVVRFAAADDLCNSTAFTLVDFNADTLDYAKKNVDGAMRLHWRLMKANYVRMSVQGLVLDEGRMARKGLTSLGPVARAAGYDFIYCTGLYDYFSDRVTRRLTQSMYNMLAPGGRLLVCNFTPANPIRHFMKYVLDWDLTHRTAEQLRNIAPAGAKPEDVWVTMSPADVEAYLHVRKA